MFRPALVGIPLLLVLIFATLSFAEPVGLIRIKIQLSDSFAGMNGDRRYELEELIRSAIQAFDYAGFKVLPGERVKAKLNELKVESHKPIYNDSTQVPLGMASAADHLLFVTITGKGRHRQLTMELLQASTELPIAQSVTPWDPDIATASVTMAASKLIINYIERNKNPALPQDVMEETVHLRTLSEAQRREIEELNQKNARVAANLEAETNQRKSLASQLSKANADFERLKKLEERHATQASGPQSGPQFKHLLSLELPGAISPSWLGTGDFLGNGQEQLLIYEKYLGRVSLYGSARKFVSGVVF